MELPIISKKHCRVSFKNNTFWSLSCKRMGMEVPLEPQNLNQSKELEAFCPIYPIEISQPFPVDAAHGDLKSIPTALDASLLLPFDVYDDIAMNKDLTRALEKDRAEKINGEEEEEEGLHGRLHMQSLLRNHAREDKLTWMKEHGNLSIQRCIGSLFTQRHSSSDANWLSIRFLKDLLGGRILSILSHEHKERRKDMCRAQRAQADAILSVAGVAAAMAGFTAEYGANDSTTPALSATASLVASVCAEVATFVGADRARVSAVVESAIGGCSLEDILTLTASAEARLRGAAVLQRRTQTRNCQLAAAQDSRHHLEDDDHLGSMIDELALHRGAYLTIRTQDGNPTQMRNVRVYRDHNRVVMVLTKKYCGVFKTSKQYAIVSTFKEEEKGVLHLLKVNTRGDSFVIVFRDKKQRNVWGFTITHLLDCNNHM